jgi:hypothetical protein
MRSEQERNVAAMAITCANIRKKFKAWNGSRASRSNQDQLAVDLAVDLLVGDEHNAQGLGAALQRVFGITKEQLRRRELRKQVLEKETMMLARMPASYGPAAPKDLEFLVRYFHTKCSLVEPDKERAFQYTRKKAVVRGKRRQIVCQRKLLLGTRREAAEEAKRSSIVKEWEARNGESLSLDVIQSCICSCIRMATVRQCVCKYCTGMTFRLAAWNSLRNSWHQQPAGGCKCHGCMDPERRARFMRASKSSEDFMVQVCCEKESWPGCELPHTPGVVPEFFPLRCCKVRVC